MDRKRCAGLGACLLLSAAVLGGCSVSLTAGGARVVLIRPDEAQTCRVIAPVEGTGFYLLNPSSAFDGAYNGVRNKAAALGGNAIQLIYSDWTPKLDYVVRAIAVKC
ncbi:MAG: DUF4156 domain-containing protein [SAR324 cluster bacterium]